MQPQRLALPTRDSEQDALVVVVEDDGETATLVREGLERAGFRVTLATSGADAISAVECQPIDVAMCINERPS